MLGEAVASGSRMPTTSAPSLFGGLVLTVGIDAAAGQADSRPEGSAP
jgi:hypothetical protein